MSATALSIMDYGRIIRIVRRNGTIESYVVAEPDKAKAIAALSASKAAKADRVEAIGRASAALLKEMGLTAGRFSKA